MKIYQAGRKRPITNQGGFTGLELLTVFAAIAIAVILLLPVLNSIFGSNKVNNAMRELSEIQNAAKTYLAQENTYTGIGFTAMSTAGTPAGSFPLDASLNTYNLASSIVSAASGGDATITYATDDAGDCNAIIKRFGKNRGIKGTPTCTTNTATFTLE